MRSYAASFQTTQRQWLRTHSRLNSDGSQLSCTSWWYACTADSRTPPEDADGGKVYDSAVVAVMRTTSSGSPIASSSSSLCCSMTC